MTVHDWLQDNPIRNGAVSLLYGIANKLCILADRLSPPDDHVWRERRWKQQLPAGASVLDIQTGTVTHLPGSWASNFDVHKCCVHCEPNAHASHAAGCP